MDERNQQRIGMWTTKRGLRVAVGKAIDLSISAMAILLTGSALVKFSTRRRKTDNLPRAIPRRGPDSEERNQPQSGHQTSEINLRVVAWSAIGLVTLVIAVCVMAG